jgi:hypothetical protein
LKNAPRCKHFTWPLPRSTPPHPPPLAALHHLPRATRGCAVFAAACVQVRRTRFGALGHNQILSNDGAICPTRLHAPYSLVAFAQRSNLSPLLHNLYHDRWCLVTLLLLQVNVSNVSRIFVHLHVVALMFCALTTSPHMLKSSREKPAVLTCCGRPTGIPGFTLVSATR